MSYFFNLRVRGFKAVRFCATLKAVGLNIFRATAAQRAVNNSGVAHGVVLSAQMHAVFVVKEHFVMVWRQLGNYLIPFSQVWVYAYANCVKGV